LIFPLAPYFIPIAEANYTSAEFAAVLDGLGIRQSVARTGICFDNALAESFNAGLESRVRAPYRLPDKEEGA
jgi:transposase InsO family protein